MGHEPADGFLGHPSRASIGFAIRDARGRSAAFQIELPPCDDDGERHALVFGAESEVRIEGKGVLPAHFVVLPTEEGLVVATADVRRPAILNGQPLGLTWSNLEIPSRIRAGNARVDFFYVSSPPGEARARAARPPAALAGPSAPPPRGVAALEARARRVWAETPPSSRLLLGLVALLLAIIVVR